ncbi:MAG: HAD-IIB family hydrolase [Thermodesulfobacteriota bacterium]|nr:HAD-IIB family hydrolase [Thermodesulfobacteriota bacterium]
MKKTLVFTDLDGTLMDHDTYAFEDARESLAGLNKRSIPVIICSSKTRAEIETCQERMGLRSPFVAENGAAVFVPRGTLNMDKQRFVEKGPYQVVELGTPYPVLCHAWKCIRDTHGLAMRGFSEMTHQEIADRTGLPLEEARLAAMREYTEPFVFTDGPDRMRLLEGGLEEEGLKVTKGGRFYHVIGQNDKGKAVQILTELYEETSPNTRLETVGLGDSANDIPMLLCVDIPVVIRKKSGGWEHVPAAGPVIYSGEQGPKGWAETVRAILW